MLTPIYEQIISTLSVFSNISHWKSKFFSKKTLISKRRKVIPIISQRYFLTEGAKDQLFFQYDQ